jgi:hypothetical protein
MLIFKNNIDPLYFIHIPRTGGRYIRDLFWKNNFLINFYRHDEHFMGKEIPHLHYPFYNKFTNFGKIPQFTIVRNPITRFISTFFASIKKDDLNIDVNEIFQSKNNFEKFIFQQLSKINYHTNWFLPQVNFINSSCKIWKFENGLDNKFYKWMESNFKVKFKIKNINKSKYSIVTEYDFYKKIKLNKKTKEFIKEFYKHDYKLLNYK